MPHLRSPISNAKIRYLIRNEAKPASICSTSSASEDLDVGILVAQARRLSKVEETFTARRTGATNHPAQAMMLARAKLKVSNALWNPYFPNQVSRVCLGR